VKPLDAIVPDDGPAASSEYINAFICSEPDDKELKFDLMKDVAGKCIALPIKVDIDPDEQKDSVSDPTTTNCEEILCIKMQHCR